jgi:hypothetical protein
MIAIGFGVDSRRRLGSLTVMVPRLPPDAVRAQCRAPSSYFPGRVIGSRIGRPDRRCRASSGRERSHLQRRRFRKVRHRHSQSVGGVTSDVEIILKRKLFSRDRRLATTEDCPRNGCRRELCGNCLSDVSPAGRGYWLRRRGQRELRRRAARRASASRLLCASRSGRRQAVPRTASPRSRPRAARSAS